MRGHSFIGWAGFSALVIALGFCGVAHAVPPAPSGIIDIDFQGDGNTIAVGPAILGHAGDVWNPMSGGAGGTFGPNSLLDTSGDPVNAMVAYTADGGVPSININDQPLPDLMNDYIFNQTGGSLIVQLTGLDTNASYRLVLYTASGDADDSNRSLVGTANTTSFSAFGNPEPSFVAGQNYLDLTVTSDAAGKILITISDDPVNNFSHEVDLNGLQITEVPEPASIALFGMAGLGLLMRRRAR